MLDIKITKSTWKPSVGDYRNALVLYSDNWNDYGYYTLYHVVYCDVNGRVKEIGSVKIYCTSMGNVENEGKSVHKYIKEKIVELDERFCSLGQSLNYYTNLKKILPEEYLSILTRMRDMAVNENIKESFIEYEGVQNSLLRESSAEKALNEASTLLETNRRYQKNMSFRYKTIVPYSSNQVELNFLFQRNENLPYRINALVGKNGTGKTQILSRLADSLSGFTDVVENKKSVFVDNRPPVDKVMSISYSAFDSFKKKREGDSLHSYVYCGIQSEEGTLRLEQLQANFKKALIEVKERERYQTWKSVIGELMEEEHKNIVEKIEKGDIENINWSSGQHILISTITELLANIENESIILFDEPEIHLHPNAIANVMRMFNKLLNEFDSYAIFATHSPIILQELPSRNIQVIERMDNIVSSRNPSVECFGENITQIISDVFDVSRNESCYKQILDKLSTKFSEEELLELFDNKLSINAMVYVKSLY